MRLMSLFRDAFRLFSRSNAGAANRRTRRGAKSWRPRLEPLEDRLAPAVVLWDGGPSGTGTDWGVAANWVGDVLPGINDDAVIESAFSAITITSSANVTIQSVTSAAALQITAATYSVAMGSSISNNFTLNGGELTGAGNLSVTSGEFNWTAGTMSGSGQTVIAAALTGTISGTGDKFLGRTLTNAGNITYSGSNLNFRPSPLAGTISNSGIFNASGDGDFSVSFGSGNSFTNSGTFNRSGSGTTTFSIGLNFYNSGTVSVQAGTLQALGGGSSNGAFTINSGATLEFGNAQYTLTGGTVAGAGLLRNAALALTVSTNITVANVENTAGILNGTGNVTVSSQFIWSGGAMEGTGQLIVQAGATATMSGGLLGRTLINAGTLMYSGGDLILLGPAGSSGAIINTGTFNVAGEADFYGTSGGGQTLTNSGTFNRSGTGTTSLIAVAFSNGGTANIQAGTLELTGGGSSGGAIAISTGAVLSLVAGPYSLTGGAVTGAGLLRLAGGLTVSANMTVPNFEHMFGRLTGAGNLTVTSQFSWSEGGFMEGTGQTILDPGAIGTITGGPVSRWLGRTLVNAGTLTYSGGSLRFGPEPGSVGRILNSGTFNALGAVHFIASNPGAHDFINSGTFNRSGIVETLFVGVVFNNTGTVNIQGALQIEVLSNSGTVNVQSGAVLNVFGTFTNFNAGTSTLTGGSYVVTGTFRFSGANIVTNAATIVLDGPGSAIVGGADALANFATNAGTFTVQNGRNFTTSGFSNAGTLTVGLGSAFTVSGNLSNFSGSTLFGGTYIVAGTFRFTGANIVTNGARIVLSGSASAVLNQSGMNALANFALNAAAGSFAVQNARTFTTTASFSNVGTLVIGSGSTFGVSGNLINFASGTLAGGTYDISGTFRFTGANIITNAANITLDGPGSAIVNESSANALANFAANAAAGNFAVRNGRNLTTAGAFNNAGSVTVGTASTFTATGSYTQAGTTNVLSSGALSLEGDGTASGGLNNAGTITVAADKTLTLTAAFTQGGSVSLQANATAIVSGGGTNSGTVSLADGAKFNISAGNYTLAAGTSVTGTGALRVSGGTLTLGAAVTLANLELADGTLTGDNALTVTTTFNWQGGTMSGNSTTTVSGTLALSGTADKTLSQRTLDLAGITAWSEDGNLILASAAVINNQGTGQFFINNDRNLSGSGTFNNAGALIKTGATGTTSVAGTIAFTNSGTVSLQTGALNLGGTYTQTAGATVLAAGTTFGAEGRVDLQAGVLSGSGTINGNVTSAGTVIVGGEGTAGVLRINGNYTQAETGVLVIELGGTDAGTFDRLAVSGTAALAGTLVVALINEFVPTTGNSFQILTFDPRSGEFGAIEDGGLFQAVYGDNDLVLVAL